MGEQLDCYGRCILRLTHPSISLEGLTRAIGLPAEVEWRVGDLHYRGPNTPPKMRRSNHWAACLPLGNQEFGVVVKRIVGILLAEEVNVRKFVDAGGDVEIYLQLNGRKNCGDELESAVTASIGRLGAKLSFEVFPDYGGGV